MIAPVHSYAKTKGDNVSGSVLDFKPLVSSPPQAGGAEKAVGLSTMLLLRPMPPSPQCPSSPMLPSLLLLIAGKPMERCK